MNWLLNLLFDCQHKHVTWPVRNTQSCTDCGKTWFYDFEQLGFPIPRPRLTQPIRNVRKAEESWEHFETLSTLMARERRVGIARVK